MGHPHDTSHELTAAELLAPMLRSQVEDLRHWEAQVREQQPESVHQFRVATRRLRSMLAGYEPLLDDQASRTLVNELRRAAVTIGGGRDVQAVRTRLDALFSEEADATSSRVHVRLTRHLDLMGVESWQRSLDHLNHADYDDFTRRLERFADLPPWLPSAELPANEALRPILRSEWSRFRRNVRGALDHSTSPDDERLHETRKASKRARYVAESLVGLFGRKAKRMGKASKRVQTALGKHQDSRLVREFLIDATGTLPLDDDEARTLARIQQREVARMSGLAAEIEQSLHDTERTSLRSWLR